MKIVLNGEEQELLIGMDAEFFVKNDQGYIAAARVIPGLKTDPFVLEHGVCHPDGLSLEVGAPPADTPLGMIKNLFKVLDEVQDKFLTPKGCTVAYTESVTASLVQGTEPADLVFGCGSEYDAYSPMMYKQAAAPNQRKRYSGFHIHLGYTKGQESNVFTYNDNRRLVQALDVVFLAAGLETTPDRATQYGGRGAFRVKPYGIEYRMMDCTVITNAGKLQKLIRCLERLPEIFALAVDYYEDKRVQVTALRKIGAEA